MKQLFLLKVAESWRLEKRDRGGVFDGLNPCTNPGVATLSTAMYCMILSRYIVWDNITIAI